MLEGVRLLVLRESSGAQAGGGMAEVGWEWPEMSPGPPPQVSGAGLKRLVTMEEEAEEGR